MSARVYEQRWRRSTIPSLARSVTSGHNGVVIPRRTRPTSRLAPLAVATVLLLATAPASATTVVLAGLPELADRAELVVEGVVLSASEFPATGGMVYTDTVVRVTRSFKGARVDELIVRMPGGDGVFVEGTPKLKIGSHVLLFLERGNLGDTWVVLGLGQGHFVLEADSFRRNLAGIGFLALGYSTGGEDLEVIAAADLRKFLARRFEVNR